MDKQRNLEQLNKDVRLMMRLFDLLLSNPRVVTREILFKGKDRLQKIYQGVHQAQLEEAKSIYEQVQMPGQIPPIQVEVAKPTAVQISNLPKDPFARANQSHAAANNVLSSLHSMAAQHASSGIGELHPVLILDEVINAYAKDILIETSIFPDQLSTLAVSDSQFRIILQSLLETALQSQTGSQSKTCEMHVASDSGSLLLKFKDFRRDLKSADPNRILREPQFVNIQNILKGAGGGIAVTMNPSKFATFTLRIPFAR